MTQAASAQSERTISEAIREAVGTDMWVVARSLTPKLKAKGYTVAIPVARYKAIVEAHYVATGRCWCCGAKQVQS